ncbi:hypothetical protein KIW84_034693 [Lathyrus oleraceus]|uniref:Uncharacterized protein n=1 Tax=Pisum sativum TaxID=3888 RepID=A0A9D4XZA1_PEA|nr:hypothetical protein KIW84_034693 [Pisum sativum]
MATSSKAPKEASVSIKTTATRIKAPKKILELPHFTTLSTPLAVGNQQYIPEPKTEEHHIIYASQVLIPVSVSRKNHALSGPLTDLDIDSNKLRELFPSYHKCKPIGKAKNLRTGITTTENPKASEVIDLRKYGPNGLPGLSHIHPRNKRHNLYLSTQPSRSIIWVNSGSSEVPV